MKNSFTSFVLPLLFLGACFHLSYQSSSNELGRTLIDSAQPVQFSDCTSIHSAAGFLISDLEAAPDEYIPAPASSDMHTFEDNAYKVADILTVIARLIIALTGAIFGVKKLRE